MKYILLAALITFLSDQSFGQKGRNYIDSTEVNIAEIKEDLIKIKDDYYVIQPVGNAGNIGVFVGKEGVILVDNQWAKLAPRIKGIVKTITNKPIKYIINTHYHFDHVDGNKIFGKENVPIIAHINVRQRLSKNQVISGAEDLFGIIHQKAYPFEGLPSITFTDSMQLYDEKETIRIIHFKHAHTDGDAIVHFKRADIYHTGDIFVRYGVPVIDERNGGDIYAMIKTIDYLLSVSNSKTRFIPGHGPVASVEELADYRRLLTSIKNQVIILMKKGYSLERTIQEVKIDEKIGGFKKEFIPHVYRMALKHEKIKK